MPSALRMHSVLTPRHDRTWARLTLLAATALIVWIAYPALSTRFFVVSWDLQGHLLRAEHWARDIAGLRQLTAWFPYWHGGFPLPDVYPPLTTWILGAFARLGVAQGGARLFMVGMWAAAIPASYYFLRSFDVRRPAAAAAAALVAGLNAPRTFGGYAVVWLGMLPNGLGFILAILALGKVKRTLSHLTISSADLARAGLLCGLTLLAHPFCGLWLAIACGALVASEMWRCQAPRRPVKRGAAVAVLAAAIGSFYWVPFLAGRSNLLTTDPFHIASVTGTWKSLAGMVESGGWPAAILGMAGLTAMAAPGRRRELIFFSILMSVSASLTLGVGGRLFGEVLSTSQRARFEGFYMWSVLMSAGFAFEWALGRLERHPRAGKIAVAAIVAASAAIAVPAALVQRRHVMPALPAGLDDVRRLASALSSRWVQGDFILSEIVNASAGALGSPHALNQRLPRTNPYFWDQAGGFPEGTRGARAMAQLARGGMATVCDASDALARHGVRFVASTRAETRQALDACGDLQRIWPVPPDSSLTGAALFEVRSFATRFGLPREIATRLKSVSFDPVTGYDLEFLPFTTAQYPCETALSFHPWLVGSADGETLHLEATDDGRLAFSDGPTGWTDLTISYRPPQTVKTARILALTALCLGAAFSVGGFRRRRRL